MSAGWRPFWRESNKVSRVRQHARCTQWKRKRKTKHSGRSMKATLKLKLLSGACLMIAASVQAQNYVNGDLLVGFSGGGNDFIYDLGQFSSLHVGETWSLGPGLGTKFGVVGAQATGKHIYATSAD